MGRFRNPDLAVKMKFFRKIHVLNFVKHFDPGLHLRGFGRLGTETVDVVFQFLFFPFRILLGCPGKKITVFPLFYIKIVIARVAGDFSTVDFHRNVCQRVQQKTVV